jgi:oligopeptide transport system substrate-binding protein
MRFHPTSPARVLAPAAAALGLLGLSGCSNNPYPPGDTAKNISHRYFLGDLRTLDPSNSYTVNEAAITDVIYSSFYKYHYLKQHPYELVLNLGAEEPKRESVMVTDTVEGKPVQKKGELWTFKFKKGLRFQNDPCFPGGQGREVVAADVAYAFRRMADPRLKPNCPVLAFVQDKILGMDAYARANLDKKKKGEPIDLTQGVEGLEVDPADPYTLRVRLNQPYPQLRYLMAMHFTTPIAHEAVEHYDNDLLHRAVGCGPYVLSKYEIKRQMVLDRNPNAPPELYPTDAEAGTPPGLLKDAGKQLPLTDRIVFSFQRETITGWNLFMQGYLDSWTVRQENLRQVVTQGGQLSPEMQRKGVQLFKAPQPSIMYFIFNMDDPVVGGYSPEKRKLRQAISTAIDAQAFIDLMNMGVGQTAQGLIPPGLTGFDENYKNPYRQTSVERAKQLLAEAGYPGGKDSSGKPLTIYYEYVELGASQRQFASLLQRQVESIGLKLEPRAWRDVIWQDKVDSGKFQMVFYGWVMDYPDPENFVFLLYGPNKRPGPNHSAYHSAEYDALFEKMRSMDDGPERLAIIHEMRDLVQEDCPLVYLYHDEDLLINHQWLGNVNPHGVANDLIKYRTVDGPRRAALQREWNQPNFWPAIGLAVFIVAGSIPAAGVVSRRRRRKVRKSE